MRLLRITTVPISLRVLLRGQLEFMTAHGFEVLAVSAPGPDAAALVVPHQAVPMTRAITPLRDLLSLIRLVFLVRRFRPDIVHTHTPKAGLLGMLAAWICRVPVRIHTVAGLPWLESRGAVRWLLKAMERLTIFLSTDILVNSDNLRTILRQELAGAGTDFRLIGNGSSNGIDTGHFSPKPDTAANARSLRSELGFRDDDFVFCFIGRVVAHKGVSELVAAFDRLKASHPRVRLCLVGPVEKGREDLPFDVTERIHRGDGIIAAGLVEDVRPWLEASQVLVLPTYREGFPNVLLQAGCMGVPVIATDINGCNEIIRDRERGLLVPPKDADALCQAMRYAVEHPEQMSQWASVLQAHVLSHYDQRRFWTELLTFYRQQLTLKPGV